ncbi:hypothetical protein [Deinococcus marmoris]|uniref:hypothetical protein n=1 Tax=Deinococcus marmoris TaxID=249408 RepID=UPI000496E5ED|nr:hypothetical protein [Deinococcus marmoris]
MNKLITLNLLTASLNQLSEAASVTLPETARQARNMYDGHHLGEPLGAGAGMNFAYWRGPMVRMPEGATEQQQRAAQSMVTDFQNALTRSFTSTNFVRETLTREIASCTAKMNWTLIDTGEQATLPPDGERTLLEGEADILISAWWRTARKHPEKAIRQALTFARREGRSVLRFRVAAGAYAKGEDGRLRVKTQDMAQIARFIRLECVPAPERVAVWENADTFEASAVYVYQDGKGTDSAETCHIEEGKTLLRLHKAGGEAATILDLDLGGRILYLELKTDPAITAQFLQNQMAYNTASTMILRNTELAGFLERWGINIEPPYELVDDPGTPGQKMKRYSSARPGAGTMMTWQQSTIKTRDARGGLINEQPLGSAQYGRFEPSPPDSLISATTHNMLNMYSEVDQSYVLMGKDATASGRSREVAISDFDNIRQPTIDLAEATIGEVCEVFLALVSALAGQAGHFDSIQVEGEVKSRIVPPSPLDRQADREDVKVGVISKHTARQRQGIDDPEQEDAQIEREGQAALPAPGENIPPKEDPPKVEPPKVDPPPDPKPPARKGRKK